MSDADRIAELEADNMKLRMLLADSKEAMAAAINVATAAAELIAFTASRCGGMDLPGLNTDYREAFKKLIAALELREYEPQAH